MSKAIQTIYYFNFLTNEDLALDHSTASDGHRGLQTALSKHDTKGCLKDQPDFDDGVET